MLRLDLQGVVLGHPDVVRVTGVRGDVRPGTHLVTLGGGQPAAGDGVDGRGRGREGAPRVLHAAVVAADVRDAHHGVADDLPLDLDVPLVRVGVLTPGVVEEGTRGI